MKSPKLLSDGLSGLNRRRWFKNSSRARRRCVSYRPSSTAEAALLEPRCLLSKVVFAGSGPVDMPAPYNPTGNPNAVVWLGDSNHPAVPVKTITITNNLPAVPGDPTANMLYPFLRDPNDHGSYQDPNQPFVGSAYDPEDPREQEYRGYVGYEMNGTNYLGLPAGASITITIPLVFWDGARIYVATNAKYLLTGYSWGAAITGNPFQYYKYGNGTGTSPSDQTLLSITDETMTGGLQGKVMWYHATFGNAPLDEAPAQLGEFTIRDPYQYQNLNPTLPQIPPLFNYDMSNVNTIMVPIALEASDVPLRDGQQVPAPTAFGWIGASQTIGQFQAAINAFTSTGAQNGLGTYFGPGGPGWPQLYNPDSAVTGITIPSGQEVLGLTPLGNHRSAYDQNQFELTSSGAKPVQVASIGGDHSSGDVIYFAPSWKPQLELVAKGMVVVGSDGDTQPGTTVQSVDLNPDSMGFLEVTVNKSTMGLSSQVYTFYNSVSDYVATTLANLWYGWANYYYNIQKNVNPDSVVGTIKPNDITLTFKKPVPASKLVVGMPVSGPGMPSAYQATILGITYTNASNTLIGSVTLSKFSTTGGSGEYNFGAVAQLKPVNSVLFNGQVFTVNPYTITFKGANAQQLNTADRFAQTVYSVLSSFGTIPYNPGNANPATVQLLFNIIGDNTGFVPHIGVDANPIDTRIAGLLTVDVKSLLRGVPNFIQVPESTGLWYPNPARPTPSAYLNGQKATFGIYNLDPFVWFVHKELGLSGYGFSVDDDTSDVEADYSNHIDLSIQGLNGITNTAEWTFGAQYGPVSSTGTPVKNPVNVPDQINSLSTAAFLKTWPTGDGQIGPLVNGPGIQPGTRVLNRFAAQQNNTNIVTLDTKFAANFRRSFRRNFRRRGESPTYSFFGMINFTGTIHPHTDPSRISGLDPVVLQQLEVIAPDLVGSTPKTPEALTVSGPGVQHGTLVVAIDPTTGSVLLNKPLLPTQPRGTYVNQFHFA
jgi:hypothetical protein